MSDELKMDETADQETESAHEKQEMKGHTHPHGDHKKECKDCKKLTEDLEKLRIQFNQSEKEKSELDDSYKRKVAEFDNYRKRMLKQMEDSSIESTRKLVSDILPIMDNFERALKDAEKNKSFDSLYNGLKITASQIQGFFQKAGIEAIDSIGKEFDPNLHEALMMEEREDVEHSATVLEELEKGYRMGERIIRHSKVKVAKKKNK